MPTIATLTMNPAIDVSIAVDRIVPGVKMRCQGGSRDPGGGGVNVARVVKRLGAEAVAVYPAGGEAGAQLRRLVAREAVESVALPIAGETREDVTVFEASSGSQYRFVLPGPHVQDLEWMACLKALAHLPTRPDVICASGSLPPGVPNDFYRRVAAIAEGYEARFVLDASGAPLKAALDGHVHLIKPNLAEMREYAGATLDETALVHACRKLIAENRVEAVALTLGADGALLVTADGAWRAHGAAVTAVSTVGAGDSFLGGMIWAQAEGHSWLEAFRYGVAAGTAAVLAAGTELAHAAEIHRQWAGVEIAPLAVENAA
ncbi:MAG: 1-phosphofructokinase family hexose kinase [Proteobacteria bacterium]|nr:1-phosphofructokinase family hexose kinase [Pseudomonadota bacterium]